MTLAESFRVRCREGRSPRRPRGPFSKRVRTFVRALPRAWDSKRKSIRDDQLTVRPLAAARTSRPRGKANELDAATRSSHYPFRPSFRRACIVENDYRASATNASLFLIVERNYRTPRYVVTRRFFSLSYYERSFANVSREFPTVALARSLGFEAGRNVR